jgi:hypothetical protein
VRYFVAATVAAWSSMCRAIHWPTLRGFSSFSVFALTRPRLLLDNGLFGRPLTRFSCLKIRGVAGRQHAPQATSTPSDLTLL